MYKTRCYVLMTLLVFSCVVLLTSGCSALGSRLIAVRAKSYEGPVHYPGVKWDAECIADLEEVAGPVYGVIDIVPSAVIDTLFFPFDSCLNSHHKSPNKSPEPTPAGAGSSASRTTL